MSYPVGTFLLHSFDSSGITDGKLDYNLDWDNLSSIGKDLEFEWGGDWKKVDLPHFQMQFGNTIKSLREKVSSGNTINDFVDLSENQ